MRCVMVLKSQHKALDKRFGHIQQLYAWMIVKFAAYSKETRKKN